MPSKYLQSILAVAAIQSLLANNNADDYRPVREETDTHNVLREDRRDRRKREREARRKNRK